MGLIGKFFKINIFNILTSQKQDMTEIKLVWLVITTGHCPKIILSPDVAWMDEKDFTVFVKISTLSRCAWYHLQNRPTAAYQLCPEERICLLDFWIALNVSCETNFQSHFCAYEAIFLGLIGKFFKINIFNILTSQKQDMTEIKLVWLVITTGHCPKIILSPDVAWMDEKDFTVFVKISTLSRCAWYHLQNPSAGLSIYRNLL